MTTELKKIEERNITDVVFNKVAKMQFDGAIDFPKNYSYSNALKSAYLILKEAKTRDKRPVLEACTQESIANALLDMVVQGLNPAKQQCYFIPYGNQLQLSRSYLGTIALTKRLKGVTDVVGYAIYKDDVLEWGFDFLTGKKILKNYVPSNNQSAENLVGALGMIIGENGILYTEYMDKTQIQKAWEQGQMKGKSGAHINFPDQMMIKSVINRACKKYVNTADDSDKIAEAFNRTMEETDRDFQEELNQNANKLELKVDEVIDISDYEEITEEVEEIGKAQEKENKNAPF